MLTSNLPVLSVGPNWVLLQELKLLEPNTNPARLQMNELLVFICRSVYSPEPSLSFCSSRVLSSERDEKNPPSIWSMARISPTSRGDCLSGNLRLWGSTRLTNTNRNKDVGIDCFNFAAPTLFGMEFRIRSFACRGCPIEKMMQPKIICHVHHFFAFLCPCSSVIENLYDSKYVDVQEPDRYFFTLFTFFRLPGLKILLLKRTF